MAYIKYKEITKYFNFSTTILATEIPKYVRDYIFAEEVILASYKTKRDHGVFTDKKIVLFDSFGATKEVTTVPYTSVSTISVSYTGKRAEISLLVDSGYPMRLKFVNMSDIEKRRLRLLYSCITRLIIHSPLDKEELRQLLENDVRFN